MTESRHKVNFDIYYPIRFRGTVESLDGSPVYIARPDRSTIYIETQAEHRVLNMAAEETAKLLKGWT